MASGKVLLTPGMCRDLIEKLKLRVSRTICLTMDMRLGSLEVLEFNMETTAWLSQWRRTLVLMSRWAFMASMM